MQISGKKILVTGGAGFIGSHLAETLLNKGYKVTVLDDFSGGSVNNIRHLFNFPNFKLIRGSVEDIELIRRVTMNINIIFHLAAKINVDESIMEPRKTIATNINGTTNILESSLENDIEHIIFASSSEVYGSAEYTPMCEKHPLNPASPYAASKAAADRLCASYYIAYGLPVTILRSFNTYGHRQKSSGYGGVISIFIRKVLNNMPPVIYGSGTQTRDYMYIEDAITAYMLTLDNRKKVVGETINFGTGKDYQIKDIAMLIISLLGKEEELEPVYVEPRPGEVMQLCANISKASKILGFRPQHSLEEGLKKYIQWYTEYRFEEWVK